MKPWKVGSAWVAWAVCLAAAAAPAAGPEERVVAAIFAELGPEDWGWRRAAELFGPQTAGAVPALARELAGERALRRRVAARALGRIGPAAAAASPALVAALRDSDAGVRSEAAIALRSVEPASAPAFPALVDLLADADSSVRLQAIASLGALDREAAIPLLVGTLDDDFAAVRIAAAEALGAAPLPAPTVGELLATLAAGDAAARRLAIRALRSSAAGEPAAREALRAALADGDAEVRATAAQVLARLAPDAPLAPPRAALSSAAPQEAGAPADAAELSLRSTADLLPGLVTLALRDDRPQVRKAAAAAIARLLEPPP